MLTFPTCGKSLSHVWEDFVSRVGKTLHARNLSRFCVQQELFSLVSEGLKARDVLSFYFFCLKTCPVALFFVTLWPKRK